MAKSQQQQQKYHQHSFINSTVVLLCFTATLLLCCGIASGSGNGNSNVGNHNHTTWEIQPEERVRRDATETEEQKSKLPVAHTTGDPEETLDHQIQLTQSNDMQRRMNPYKELNIFKRAPNGFIGMRGKKTNDEDDDNDEYFNPDSIDWSLDPLFHHNDYNAFDDEDNSDYAENLRYKKTPIAFYGVPGKKMPNNNGNSKNSNRNFLNEVIQQAEEERLREQMLQDFLGRLSLASAAENEINKRAPTGFTGLRGKRPIIWNEMDGTVPQEDEDSINKRAPVNAFVGVRGKKDVSNQQEEHQTLFKRSPSESFGGKRRISDFNNKFVAVRGKKDNAMDEMMNDNVVEERRAAVQFVARQRLRFLVALLPSLLENSRYAKRAPNGFIGMRGKRAVVSSPSAAIKLDTATGIA